MVDDDQEGAGTIVFRLAGVVVAVPITAAFVVLGAGVLLGRSVLDVVWRLRRSAGHDATAPSGDAVAASPNRDAAARRSASAS